jgi:flagellar basal body-associated protein FliL
VIIGLIIGILLLLIVGGIILIVILRKQTKKRKKQKTSNYPLMNEVGGTVVIENVSTVHSNLTNTYQPGLHSLQN